jgi:Rha family phage regulatory protein
VRRNKSSLTLGEAKELVSGSDGRLTVSSLEVASRFNQTHEQVLLSIERLDCSPDFYRRNFELDTYYDKRFLEQPLYRISKDGFFMLVLGFTSRQAVLLKERYIQAFNLLEADLVRARIELAEVRGRSKVVRVSATDSYKQHGATAWFHYVNNTDAIYEIMFGGNAQQLRRRWGLHPSANLRDHLPVEQLNHVIQIENMISLQLESRKVFNADQQLAVVRHVTTSYKQSLDAPIVGVGAVA